MMLMTAFVREQYLKFAIEPARARLCYLDMYGVKQ